MNCLIQVTIFTFAIQWCEIVCKPHYQVKNIEKRFHFEKSPLPLKYITFVLQTVTPSGKYELKHDIHKRQIAQSEISPISNEIRVNDVIAFENFPKLPENAILDKKDEVLTPEVLITSIIKPIEHGKSFSFVLPVESEVVIIPGENNDIIKQTLSESVNPELVPKHEEVVSPPEPIINIIPKPLEIPLPPLPQPPVQNVVINTPIESTVPPLLPVPVIQNLKVPITSPVMNNLPDTPLLYTDISRIPLSSVSYPTPIAVPIPDVIVPLPLPPPPPIKEPPIVKEETPNFFVKGSRFVLYFGSMMLQMLTQLVNGRINLNQPLPELLPGIQ